MPKCEYCGKEILLPFKCKYCGGYFCEDCYLPPNHDCPRIETWKATPPPSGMEWVVHKTIEVKPEDKPDVKPKEKPIEVKIEEEQMSEEEKQMYLSLRKKFCYQCGKSLYNEPIFICEYCNLSFCDEHRIAHDCIGYEKIKVLPPGIRFEDITRVCYFCGRISNVHTCAFCGDQFCSEHKFPDDHRCKANPPKDAYLDHGVITYISRKGRIVREDKLQSEPIPQSKPVKKEYVTKSTPQISTRRNYKKPILIIFLLLLLITGWLFYSQGILNHLPNYLPKSLPEPKIPSKIPQQVSEQISKVTESLAPPLKNESNIRKTENLILEYTNQERNKRGLESLIWNNILAKTAREHSKDMATRNYFSHITPEGKDVMDRAVENGYTYTQMIYVGENIFMVEGDSFVSPEELARECVDDWMGSAGHRKNILDRTFRECGVGIYLDERNSRVYITAVYGSRS